MSSLLHRCGLSTAPHAPAAARILGLKEHA
jgi:hypothetical protein